MATPPDFVNATALDASSLNSIGLWKVASGTFTGATSVSAASISDIFTSDYDNYRIILKTSNATSSNVLMQFRDISGNIIGGSAYFTQFVRSYVSNVDAAAAASTNTALLATHYTAPNVSTTIDIQSPYIAEQTSWLTNYYSFNSAVPHSLTGNGGGYHNSSTRFSGIILFPTGGSLSGSYWIYGTRK
jgi:hypothetical protein